MSDQIIDDLNTEKFHMQEALKKADAEILRLKCDLVLANMDAEKLAKLAVTIPTDPYVKASELLTALAEHRTRVAGSKDPVDEVYKHFEMHRMHRALAEGNRF